MQGGFEISFMRPPFPHLYSKVGTDQKKVATSRDNVANCSSEENAVLQRLEDGKNNCADEVHW